MDVGSVPGLGRSPGEGSGNPLQYPCLGNLTLWSRLSYAPVASMDFPGGSDGKASVYNVGDLSSIPGSGRFPGEGNGNPLQYSCLENPMDGGTWCRLLSMGSQRVRHD